MILGRAVFSTVNCFHFWLSLQLSGIVSLESSGVFSSSASPEPPLETQLEETPSAVNLAQQEEYVPSAMAATEELPRPSTGSASELVTDGPVASPPDSPPAATEEAVFEEVEEQPNPAIDQAPTDTANVSNPAENTEEKSQAEKTVEVTPQPSNVPSTEPHAEETIAVEDTEKASSAVEENSQSPPDADIETSPSSPSVDPDGADTVTSEDEPVPFNVLQTHIDSQAASLQDIPSAVNEQQALSPPSSDQRDVINTSAEPASNSGENNGQETESARAEEAAVNAGDSTQSLTPPAESVDTSEGAVGNDAPSTVEKPVEAVAKKHQRANSDEDSFPMPDLGTLDHLAAAKPIDTQSAPSTMARKNSTIEELMDSSGMIGTDLDSIIDCLTTSSINLLDAEKRIDGDGKSVSFQVLLFCILTRDVSLMPSKS